MNRNIGNGCLEVEAIRWCGLQGEAQTPVVRLPAVFKDAVEHDVCLYLEALNLLYSAS
ncbi:MAG: hypothetical protein ACI84D_002250 [Thalassolituus oleivorans]|jgi:hypothetical protein